MKRELFHRKSFLDYRVVEPGTLAHSDEVIAAQSADEKLFSGLYKVHVADGHLFTVWKEKLLWGITRESQNLALKYMEEAQRQTFSQGYYSPEADVAQAALEHKDTVIVDTEKLQTFGKPNFDNPALFYTPHSCLHFPFGNIKHSSPQNKIVFQRLFGSDEEDYISSIRRFYHKSEELTIRGGTLFVYLPPLDRLKNYLISNKVKYIQTNSFMEQMYVGVISLYATLTGVEISNNGNLYAQRRVSPPTREEILTCLRVDVAPSLLSGIEVKIKDPPAVEDLLNHVNDNVAPSLLPRLEARIRRLFPQPVMVHEPRPEYELRPQTWEPIKIRNQQK